MRRPVVASSSPRSIRSQSGSTLGRRAHPHRTVPARWQTQRVRICRCWEKSARLPGSAITRTPSLAIFSTLGDTPRWLDKWERSCGSWRRRRAVRSFGQTGTARVGWYACPWLTLFATEWSAARRKRPTAAALHLRAAISADVKAVRFRRATAENFRPEIFEARATLREQRESAVGRRIAEPQPSPVCPKDRTARLRHRNP